MMAKLKAGDRIKVSWTATVISVERNGVWVRLDTGVEAWVPFDTSKEVG